MVAFPHACARAQGYVADTRYSKQKQQFMSEMFAGSRGARGPDRVGLTVDGGARRPFCGLRLPEGQNHHHGRGQEPGRPLTRGAWYR